VVLLPFWAGLRVQQYVLFSSAGENQARWVPGSRCCSRGQKGGVSGAKKKDRRWRGLLSKFSFYIYFIEPE
jgi:hypothetical protein